VKGVKWKSGGRRDFGTPMGIGQMALPRYTFGMKEDIERILIDRKAIDARVCELARQIAVDYAGEEFLLMPLLTGSIIFVADLVRQLPRRMRIDVLAVSSYPGTATSSQGTKVLYPTSFDVAGKHVLVIDDILDSGTTLKTVCGLLHAQNAATVKSCVLLKKNLPRPAAARADYVGFEIPNEFVVGYGLDYNGYYRNLPEIATLRADVIRGM
jgi:hypoxanthine phosphoribosyltransferase